MAAGTYQPIVPWDLEAFRSGAPSFQEAANFAGVIGTPSVINSAGQLAEAGTTFNSAFAILAKTAANSSSAGSQLMAYPIRPDIVWEVTLNEAFALAQIGQSYGLLKDATTKNWYLSTADNGNQMNILAQHPATAVGDTKSRVLARFNTNAVQSGFNALLSGGFTPLTTNGAISPNVAANYLITKAGVLADTLAAPTTILDDYKIIRIVSNTANAHTVTATALYDSGSAAVNLATFAAFAGAGMVLMAYGARWKVLSSVGITFS